MKSLKVKILAQRLFGLFAQIEKFHRANVIGEERTGISGELSEKSIYAVFSQAEHLPKLIALLLPQPS